MLIGGVEEEERKERKEEDLIRSQPCLFNKHFKLLSRCFDPSKTNKMHFDLKNPLEKIFLLHPLFPLY